MLCISEALTSTCLQQCQGLPSGTQTLLGNIMVPPLPQHREKSIPIAQKKKKNYKLPNTKIKLFLWILGKSFSPEMGTTPLYYFQDFYGSSRTAYEGIIASTKGTEEKNILAQASACCWQLQQGLVSRGAALPDLQEALLHSAGSGEGTLVQSQLSLLGNEGFTWKVDTSQRSVLVT